MTLGPTQYLRAVLGRWRQVAAAALLGAVFALLAVGTQSPVHRSTTTVYVGAARVVAAADPAYAAQVSSDVAPSLAQLAASPAVVAPVTGRLHLTPARAGRVSAAVDPDTALLQITVTAPAAADAQALAAGVADQLVTQADQLYRSADGTPLLTVRTVSPAGAPTAAVAPDRRRAVALGLLGGGGAVVLAVGLLELARPRVRSARDVATLTDLPVLAELPRPARSRLAAGWRRVTGARTRGPVLDRLRWQLAVGGRPPALRGVPGPPAPDLVTALAPAGPPTGTVLVLDVRRTTAAQLTAALTAGAGYPVTGVVLDGVLADPWQWRDRLRPAPRPADGTRRWTSAATVAVLALFTVGLDRRLPGGTTSGLVAVAALLPVWIGTVRRHTTARVLGLLCVLALACGWLLAGRSSVDHAFSRHEALSTTFLVLTAAGTVGLLLWARTVAPVAALGTAFALGMLVDGVLRAPGSENVVKFQLALPLTVLVLSLAHGRRRAWPALAGLGAAGLLDITHDARSAFGFCALAAVLVLWQARPRGASRRRNGLVSVLLLPVLAWAGYSVGTELLVSGALGAEVQARTTTQIVQSGNLLLGGRPEWTATWALMRHDWLGNGLGVVPTAEDLSTARAGLAATHIPTVEGYLEHYLFAGRFELHSIVADLWSNLGVAGLLLAAAVVVAVLRGFGAQLADRRASGLVCLSVLTTLWDLAFSPLPANWPTTALTLGLVLAPAAVRHTRPIPVAAPPPAGEPAPAQRLVGAAR